MSLENIQAGTNRQRVLAGNVSASNDPSQWKHDGREVLIKGAELAAAGRTLGMSEEETLAAVSRQYRRQRRADSSVTERDVLRQMVQSSATTTTDVGTPEIQGVSYAGVSDEAFAFGEDTVYNEQYGRTRADDEQTYRANDRGFTQDEETGLVRRENFEETRGNMPNIAPKSTLRDALTRLEKATQQYGYDALPGSADVAARLEDDITPNREAEASLARELNSRDESTFSGRRRAYNNIRAEIEADQISRDMYVGGGQGQFADENIGRIAEIRSLGKIGETAHVVRTANDAITGQVTRRQDGVYLDPTTGDPVAIQGPQLSSVLAGDRIPSNGSSSDALNAPQTAQEWIVATSPDYYESNRTFGSYPQVDITLETTNFANKLRHYGERHGMPGLQQTSSNIRSVEELQKVVSFIADNHQGSLTVPDPENPGKSIAAGNNVTGGVMNAVGMTLGEQQKFANAMYQLDAARRSSVNQNQTGTYLSRTGEPTKGVVFDATEAVSRSEGGAQVARIPKGATIRVSVPDSDKPQRRSIVTELSRLQGKDAQKPFMGATVGSDGKPERPRVNRMRGKGVGEGADAGIAVRKQAERRARGKDIDAGRVRGNQVKAMLVGERATRDDANREERRRLIQDNTPANLRQEGRYSDSDQEIAEVQKRIKLQKAQRRRLNSEEKRIDSFVTRPSWRRN